MTTTGNVAVLLAGGVGRRVGASLPKQLVKIAGRPILEHALATLNAHDDVDQIIVMMAPGHLDAVRAIVRAGAYGKVAQILPGAETRSDTTLRALEALGRHDCKVLLHDAARPLLSARIISECLEALDSYDAVGVAIPSADTIISVTEANTIGDIPARASLRRIQTPQAFRASVLRKAYEMAGKDPAFVATDDCAVVLRYLPDVAIRVVAGDDRNMKVTEPVDVHLVDTLLQLASPDSLPARLPTDAHDRRTFSYSVVIPVYNSEGLVGSTVDRLIEVLEAESLSYEVILVNDGSRDGSWNVIADLANRHPHVTALNLLRNYGQHHANLAGLCESTGDYVITMDDDGQNPPEEILKLIDGAMAGHDVVFGRFERKQAAGYRRWGTKVIGSMNRRIFGQPRGLTVSNFRILRRDVVARICASRTAHPYITGQALIYSSNRSNVDVRHEQRAGGKSHYSALRILQLVFTILFSYSSYPLRLAAFGGFAISATSFVLGGVYLLMGAFGETRVEGWTTTVVLLALFNGFTIALLSMLGEYVVRTLNAVSSHESYHVVDRVSG